MRIKRLDVLEARFPFRVSFGHAAASRSSSTNVLVRIETDEQVVGFGECVPREYVTGETPESAMRYIGDRLGPPLLGRHVERFEETPSLVREVFDAADGAEPSGAARCAVELA